MAFNPNVPLKTNIALDDILAMNENSNQLRAMEKGTVYPGNPTGGMLFLKTDEGTLGRIYIRNAANTGWLKFIDDLANLPIGFPAGTKLMFPQAAAPTGWTQDTTHNDRMLRVVSGTGAGSGGNDSPIATHTHSVANHTHSVSGTCSVGGDSAPSARNAVANGGVDDASTKIVAQTFSVTSGSGGPSNTAAGFTPRYLDSIIATKD